MRGGIVAVLALLVGAGVGYLLGASKETGAPPRAASAPSPPPEGAPPPRARPAEARGEGTITGTVARPDGTPLPGATVRAAPPLATADAVDLEAEVRRYLEEIRHGGIAEATTGPDGRYALVGLADRAYEVTGRLRGYRLEPTAGSRARPGTVVDFVARTVADVAFDVRLPDGTPAPGATIRLEGANGTSEHPWSPERPRLELRPGVFVATAEHADGAYASDQMGLELREGAPEPPPVLLRLRGRSGVAGTVRFGSELPFPHAGVFALPFRGGKAPDAARFHEEAKQDWTTPDRGFRYRLLDLAAGRYLVGVALGLDVVATREVDVAGGITACDFAIDALDPALFVLVRVLDPAGAPVRDATFGTGYRADDDSYSYSTGAMAALRPDGAYVVLHHVNTRGGGGTYVLSVESPRFGRRDLSYRRGEADELVVRFLAPATLDLEVAGFASSAHAAAIHVALLPAAREDLPDGGLRAKAPDAEGRLRLGPVETGEYDLMLLVGDDPWDSLPAGTRRITLDAGRNALTVPMPALHALVVSDPGGKEGDEFRVYPETDPGSTILRATLDVDLRATFPALPEGRYALRREDGEGAMSVAVEGPAEVLFRPATYDALRVRVTDARGAWARAGFHDGDLIVAIDEVELVSADTLEFACMSLRTNEKAAVTVLRGGVRVEVEVAARGLFQGGSGGGVEWASRPR